MKQTVKRKTYNADPLMILAFLIIARICCPALSNIPVFTITFVFIYGVAFLGIFLMNTRFVTKGEMTLMVVAALYMLYMTTRSLLAGNGFFSTDAFNAYIIVFLVTIYLWAMRQPAEKQRVLVYLIFAALIFDYIYSIWVLIQDPYASRVSAAIGVLEASEYDVLNAVGSFDAVYGGISVITILVYLLWEKALDPVRKCLVFAVLALALVFLYMAAYATALIILVFTIALIFASRNKLLTILLVAGLTMVLISHEVIGQWIIDEATQFTSSEILQEKLTDFGEMLKTFEAAGTYEGDDGRLARMQWSIDTFRAHPLFGGYGLEDAHIGGHSEFTDLLGKYGLFGFAMISVFFITLYWNIHQGLESAKMKACCNIVFFIWLLTAVLNPAMYSMQMMPLFLMLPLSSAYTAPVKQL